MERDGTLLSLGLPPTQSADKLDLLSCLLEATGVGRELSLFGLAIVYFFSAQNIPLGYSRTLTRLTRIMGSFLGRHLTLLIKAARSFPKSEVLEHQNLLIF